MKKFMGRAFGYLDIQEVEIERETTHRVVIDGRFKNKISDYEIFADTSLECFQWYMNKLEAQIKDVEKKVNYYTRELSRLKSELNELDDSMKGNV